MKTKKKREWYPYSLSASGGDLLQLLGLVVDKKKRLDAPISNFQRILKLCRWLKRYNSEQRASLYDQTHAKLLGLASTNKNRHLEYQEPVLRPPSGDMEDVIPEQFLKSTLLVSGRRPLIQYHHLHISWDDGIQVGEKSIWRAVHVTLSPDTTYNQYSVLSETVHFYFESLGWKDVTVTRLDSKKIREANEANKPKEK